MTEEQTLRLELLSLVHSQGMPISRAIEEVAEAIAFIYSAPTAPKAEELTEEQVKAMAACHLAAFA